MKIVVLFSGRGSNLEALLAATSNNRSLNSSLSSEAPNPPYSSYEIVAAITDGYAQRTHCGEKIFDPPGGIKIAQKWGIPCLSLPRQRDNAGKFTENKATYHQRLVSKIIELKADLVALAGFMQLLTPEFVGKLTPNLINIHPSLLPNLPGLDTHARAIALYKAGELTEHGVTIHQVDEGMDTGPIIGQMRLKLLPDDDELTLAAKVLQLEHCIYPFLVEAIAKNEICLTKRVISKDAADRAMQLGIEIKVNVR